MSPHISLRRLALGVIILTATATTVPSASMAGSIPSASMAGSIQRVDRLPTGTKIMVVDLRSEKACERASVAQARCLPVSSLFDTENRPLPFYALRWLLGTIGLTGQEDVVLYGGNTNAAQRTTWAAAGLLYLAGQNSVAVLDVPLNEAQLTAQGRSRGFSREAVFTAPMRDPLIRLGQTGDTLGTQLASFARDGGTKTITIARPN